MRNIPRSQAQKYIGAYARFSNEIIAMEFKQISKSELNFLQIFSMDHYLSLRLLVVTGRHLLKCRNFIPGAFRGKTFPDLALRKCSLFQKNLDCSANFCYLCANSLPTNHERRENLDANGILSPRQARCRSQALEAKAKQGLQAHWHRYVLCRR